MSRYPVILRCEQPGSYAEAELIDRVDVALAKRAEDSWQTYLATAKAVAAAANQPFPVLEHDHWQWERKVSITERLLPYPTLAIECAGEVQGLMLLETDGHFGRLPGQTGSPLVYINLLATAPWNLPAVARQPRYRGVGTLLIAAAVTTSSDLGFKGRLGLHSLPKSELWYERLGLTCVGQDQNKQNLKYYEMTPDQAKELIR